MPSTARMSGQVQNENPSLFIALPSLSERGKCWTADNIREVIDNNNFGEIEQVIIYKNKNKQEFAIIHFERWFRGAEEHAANIMRGGSIQLQALYGKYFRIVMYRQSHTNRSSRSSSKYRIDSNVNHDRESIHSNITMDDTLSSDGSRGSETQFVDNGIQLEDVYAFIDSTAAYYASLEDGEIKE